MKNCGLCHTCSHPLKTILDGEEWCDHCQAYRRYRSHGWARSVADREDDGCFPDPGAAEVLRNKLSIAHRAEGMAHLILARGGKSPVCALCGGTEAPIVGGRHLSPKEFCRKEGRRTP